MLEQVGKGASFTITKHGWSEDSTDERWADRLVIETNLVSAWKALVDRYLQRAETPFFVDPATLRREDRPPDYIAFREAAINLLIHQDYADHTRTPVIRFFEDRTTLWNPGDAYASAEELLEPGDREVRNPRIVGAFRRIGLSEQAGTGMRAIYRNWRQLGRVPPVVDNDRARKAFRVTLLKEELLSEEQLLFQASLGVHLNEAEAGAFALVCRQGRVRPLDIRMVAGLSSAAARAVLEQLAVQGLVTSVGSADAPIFSLAEHLRGRLDPTDPDADEAQAAASGLVTDQVQPGRGDMSTAQADADPDDLSTAQAGSGPTGLSSAHAGLSGDLSATCRRPVGDSGEYPAVLRHAAPTDRDHARTGAGQSRVSQEASPRSPAGRRRVAHGPSGPTETPPPNLRAHGCRGRTEEPTYGKG